MTIWIGALTILLLLSALFAVAMLIAWRSFGRPPHALTWSVAFGLGALEYGGSVANVASGLGGPWVSAAFLSLAMLISVVMLAGFRQRAGLSTKVGPAVAATGAALGLSWAIALWTGQVLWIGAGVFFFRAATTAAAVGVASLHGGVQASTAERATAIVLAAATLINIGGGVLMIESVLQPPPVRTWANDLLLVMLPVAYAGTGLFAVFLLAADLAHRMHHIAGTDPLTGVLNRRGFELAAERALGGAVRFGRELSVVLADLDRFKSINDEHGHAAGDNAIRSFAQLAQNSIRQGDLFGRLGGEEFGFLLQDTGEEAAADAIDRIRQRVKGLVFDYGVTLTCSFGVAVRGSDELTMAPILARADRALYASKQAGRDRVTRASTLTTSTPERLNA